MLNTQALQNIRERVQQAVPLVCDTTQGGRFALPSQLFKPTEFNKDPISNSSFCCLSWSTPQQITLVFKSYCTPE